MKSLHEFKPHLIAWEVTRTCNLNCLHCRAGATKEKFEGELTLGEIKKTLKSIAAVAKPIIILTGGEPMLRTDLYEIAGEVRAHGMKPVLAPCGTLIDDESVRKMKDSGIERVSISIDGKDEKSHDEFRGMPGAFKNTIRGIEALKRGGMPFQINTTLTKRNINDLSQIFDFVIKTGAVAFHPFMLVPTGRGRDLKQDSVSPQEYEKVLNWVYDRMQDSPIDFHITCAPHFNRVYREREKEKGKTVTPKTHGRIAVSKGCMGGKTFAFISYEGKIQICGFLDAECGDLRKANYDFVKIWETSEVFLKLRDVNKLKDRCGVCEYRAFCAGCRARAYAIHDDILGQEPFCTYKPKRKGNGDQ